MHQPPIRWVESVYGCARSTVLVLEGKPDLVARPATVQGRHRDLDGRGSSRDMMRFE